MSGDVRIKIQNYKSMLTAVKNEVAFIVFGVGRHPAEDTPLRFGINT